MAKVLLSASEKSYVLHGVDEDFRTDGRNCRTYRPMELEVDVGIHACCSARLRLGKTNILVAVKTEIDTPNPEKQNEGKIDFFVYFSLNTMLDFEERDGEELALLIKSNLVKAYQSPKTLNLASLIIIPGKRCWKIYVDILILEFDGNLFDAISLAVKSALYKVKVPKLTSGDVDIPSSSNNCSEFMRLDIANAPVFVTLCMIGDHCVVDPTAEEEACSDASIVMAVTENGLVTTVFKTGDGSYNPSTLHDILIEGKEIGCVLNKALKAALAREGKKDKEDNIVTVDEPY